jgi:hypothetical protein
VPKLLIRRFNLARVRPVGKTIGGTANTAEANSTRYIARLGHVDRLKEQSRLNWAV